MEKSPQAFRSISEAAEVLDVQTHVLRFWESRFSQVKPVKGAGGRRYYRPSDITLLLGIKRLLHDDGLTIRGVQKVFKQRGVPYVAALGLSKASLETILPRVQAYVAQRNTAAADQPTKIIAFPKEAAKEPPASANIFADGDDTSLESDVILAAILSPETEPRRPSPSVRVSLASAAPRASIQGADVTTAAPLPLNQSNLLSETTVQEPDSEMSSSLKPPVGQTQKDLNTAALTARLRELPKGRIINAPDRLGVLAEKLRSIQAKFSDLAQPQSRGGDDD